MSLKAIAAQLGLSVTTVSRALNGYDDVSQETRGWRLKRRDAATGQTRSRVA